MHIGRIVARTATATKHYCTRPSWRRIRVQCSLKLATLVVKSPNLAGL